MAKTFNLDDPGQLAGFREESLIQWMLHGQNYLSYDKGSGTVTLYDSSELEKAGDGFRILSHESEPLL